VNFIANPDGSITVSATIPAITWSLPAGTDISSYYTVHGSYPNLVPNVTGTVQHNGPVPALKLYSGNPYKSYLVLHLQFGTDPTNTIKDYLVSISSKLTAAVSVVNAVSENVAVELDYPGGVISYTIPATDLTDSRAVNGIYGIAYTAIEWGPVFLTDTTTVPGNIIEVIEYGTNAQGSQALPPGPPLNLTGVLRSDNGVDLSWTHSAPGTEAIAGYTLRWGLNQGGPYPNSMDEPISKYPVGSTFGYKTTVPSSFFDKDGATRYFVVQAYDDGTAPINVTVDPPNTITYWPTLPDITTPTLKNSPGQTNDTPVWQYDPNDPLGYFLTNPTKY
jgi:hypothetical protein